MHPLRVSRSEDVGEDGLRPRFAFGVGVFLHFLESVLE